MSFSYKTLNSTDITLTSYIANKQWEVKESTLSQNGVTVYIGENLPITKDYPFDPINDSQTSNEEYRRLVYESIRHLYYENYTSGSLNGQFFHSSSFFNYEQSTLVSGTIRNLPTITGSILNPNNPSNYGVALYDVSSSLYDLSSFDPDKGSKIVVISIDKKIYGSGLSPNSVNISGSSYNLQDDGEGNLLDTLATSSLYVGNVFYSQGLIVITNPDYLCVFSTPPTTLNDYFSYFNMTPNYTLDLLSNDFADCGLIDYSSVQIYGTNFPNYTQTNGIITITPDQSSVIPGYYHLDYTITNASGVRSNTSSIDLTITSLPLSISNVTRSFTCYGTSSLIPVTCSINYGVPYYSWSFDEGVNYSSSNSLTGITISGSILSSANNKIFIKDYTGTVYSSSFSSWYDPITPGKSFAINNSGIQSPYYSMPLCNSTASNGTIYITRGTAISASVNGGPLTQLNVYGTTFTNATTASTIVYTNAYGCTTSSIFNMDYTPQILVNFSTSSTSCYNGNNGSVTFSWTDAVETNVYTLTSDTGSNDVANGYLDPTGTGITSGSITITNLNSTSSYLLQIDGTTQGCSGQSYTKSFTIGQPSQIIFSATASFINSCSNAVIFNATGGTPPYTYFAVNTGSGITFSSDSNSVSLTNLSGSTYNLSIIDSNGCVTTSSLLTVFGRQYEYSGSVCSQSSGINNGYISSSGIQQIFTSGPYSGSLVTSSYYNGTTLNGPIIDYKQLFISGTVDNILPCSNLSYYRLYYNPALCPPGGCTIPVLIAANVPSCDNYTGDYYVSYNSGSTNAIYTYIQYSTSPTFLSNVNESVVANAFPFILPVNVNDLPAPPSSPFTTVYFRAYNSCSSGFGTSSFSNIIEASCVEPPIPEYESFTLRIKNNSLSTIRYINLLGNVVSIASAQTASFGFSGQTLSTSITIAGRSIAVIGNDYGTYSYSINVSSSVAVDCNVSTTITPLLNIFPYPTTTINCGYTGLGTNAPFDSDGSDLTYDVGVAIDRGTYTPGGIITLNVLPYY